jgi:hypothetical protein
MCKCIRDAVFILFYCTENRVDTKFRDSKFRNKNYFPILRNYNIISPKFLKTAFAISRFPYKGNGTSVAVLHLYDSFHQKCSKLGTYTTQDLKNNFYFRGFSTSSGPEPRLSDKYRQFF